MEGDELRIVHFDRGERLVAAKREKWVPYDPPKSVLRPEEKREIALGADRILRSIETHTPFRYWQRPDPADPAYDEGLVSVIVEYLGAR